MKKQILSIKILLIAMFLTVGSTYSIAQEDPGLPGDGDPVDAPIDGGLSILLAAGVGYGVKKARDQRKKKSADFKDGADK